MTSKRKVKCFVEGP